MADDGPDKLGGLKAGQVLADRYRVEGPLGRGGMGVVVAARHLQLDTRVAIKILLPGMMDHQEAVTRFAQEARAAVKITSEHVARVLDVCALENGRPYMVMEFLDGDDLATWLEERGPLAVEQAVEFLLQTCVALADAHALGIVHRDLKPSNLFVVRRSDGQLVIKVLDFGISKTASWGEAQADRAVTHSLAVMGSPLYMSPEQMQSSKDVNAQTDIWALGVIAYELLTGRVPYDGASIAEIAVKVAIGRPPPICRLRPGVPEGLQAAILKCLEKARSERYENVAEVARALAPFGSARCAALAERAGGIVDGARSWDSTIAVPPPSAGLPAPSVDVPSSSAPLANRRIVGRWAALLLTLLLFGGVSLARRSATAVRRSDMEQARSVDLSPLPGSLDSPTVRADDPNTAQSLQLEVPGPTAAPSTSQVAKRGPINAPSAASNARRRPGCDPAFYFDDLGRKHFKPECFLNPR